MQLVAVIEDVSCGDETSAQAVTLESLQPNHADCNAKLIIKREGGSVAEWSARWTRNLAASGSNPAMVTCWICSRFSRVQIRGDSCK